MANDDHVAQLNKGVAAWNAWRRKNPKIHPDLRGQTLAGRTSERQTSTGRTSSGRTSARRT